MTATVSAPAPVGARECVECNSAGYLVDQTYGHIVTAPGDEVRTVQRCDECARYDGDIEAAVAFARDERAGHGPVWFASVGWVDPDTGPASTGVTPAVRRRSIDTMICPGTDVVVIGASTTAYKLWKDTAFAAWLDYQTDPEDQQP